VVWKRDIVDAVRNINGVIEDSSGNIVELLFDNATLYTLNYSDGALIGKKVLLFESKYGAKPAQALGGSFFADCGLGKIKLFDYSGNVNWEHQLYHAGEIDKMVVSPSGELWVNYDGHLSQFSNNPDRQIPEPNPIPPPTNLAEIEKELIPCMLDYIQSKNSSLVEFIAAQPDSENIYGLSAPA
jgi:hypothetical protein